MNSSGSDCGDALGSDRSLKSEASKAEIEISVVVPSYRCDACLVELHRRLVATLEALTPRFEILLVNDASPQGDWGTIRQLAALDPRVKGINLSRNFGQHRAITAGIDCAQGNWVVVMDGDLQDPPEAIALLYRKAMEGYDVVFGRKPHRSHGYIKRLMSRLFTRVLNLLTDQRHDNAVTHFSIVSRAVVAQLRRFKEHCRSYAYFVGWLGYRVAQVEVEHHPRFAGSGSYTTARLFALALDIMLSQSEKPLRATIGLGFTVAGAALARACYDIWRYFHHGLPVPGWTSLMVSIYFLGGLQLIALGVLGLYIGRIFEEIKGRPLYVIKDTINIAPPRFT